MEVIRPEKQKLEFGGLWSFCSGAKKPRKGDIRGDTDPTLSPDLVAELYWGNMHYNSTNYF